MPRPPDEVSEVQFQKMTEQEVWKLLTGSTGLLEVMWPGSDDERVDMEAHVKECFSPHFSIQVKCVSWLAKSGKGHRLVKSFDEKVARLHSSPLFWYLFGHFDLDVLEFTNPLFYANSDRVHRFADPQPKGEIIGFTFEASMEPASRDRWHDCKVTPLDLAAHVLQLLEKAQAAHGMAPIPTSIPAGGIVVGLRG
jgi:hypothetical protein